MYDVCNHSTVLRYYGIDTCQGIISCGANMNIGCTGLTNQPKL